MVELAIVKSYISSYVFPDHVPGGSHHVGEFHPADLARMVFVVFLEDVLDLAIREESIEGRMTH